MSRRPLRRLLPALAVVATLPAAGAQAAVRPLAAADSDPVLVGDRVVWAKIERNGRLSILDRPIDRSAAPRVLARLPAGRNGNRRVVLALDASSTWIAVERDPAFDGPTEVWAGRYGGRLARVPSAAEHYDINSSREAQPRFDVAGDTLAVATADGVLLRRPDGDTHVATGGKQPPSFVRVSATHLAWYDDAGLAIADRAGTVLARPQGLDDEGKSPMNRGQLADDGSFVGSAYADVEGDFDVRHAIVRPPGYAPELLDIRPDVDDTGERTTWRDGVLAFRARRTVLAGPPEGPHVTVAKHPRGTGGMVWAEAHDVDGRHVAVVVKRCNVASGQLFVVPRVRAPLVTPWRPICGISVEGAPDVDRRGRLLLRVSCYATLGRRCSGRLRVRVGGATVVRGLALRARRKHRIVIALPPGARRKVRRRAIEVLATTWVRDDRGRTVRRGHRLTAEQVG